MANEVYANGREISCKAADGKSICAFPDVCLSPPSPPAGPIPIPYPNTGFATDTTDGSKTVKISGNEVMLKNRSYFKKSTGDEAATKTLGMGVVTHQITGKVYFTSWSMDVKIEGENAVRHLDLTTHNHASPLGNTAPWAYTDRMAMAEGLSLCEGDRKKVDEKCTPWDEKTQCPSPSAINKATEENLAAKARYGSGSTQHKATKAAMRTAYEDFAKETNSNECHKALRCVLVPYQPSRCCPGQTGDHVIDAASFLDSPTEKGQPRNERPKIKGWEKYNVDKAPCICAEGPNQTTATHGQLHTRRSVAALNKRDSSGKWNRQDATKTGARAITKTFPESGCSEECIEAQLNKYHDEAKTSDPEQKIKAPASMTSNEEARAAARVDMGVPVPAESTR